MLIPKINVMRSCIGRRLDKSISPNANEIWQRIRTNWPTLTEEDAEIIFQLS